MAPRCIEPANAPLDAAIHASPSKSATHRALVAAALAGGASEIVSPLDAADTRATMEGLRRLGIVIEERERSWVVHGCAGAIGGGATIALGASGTSARFLTAVAALGERPSLLDGSPRLRERPMDELVTALATLGATIAPQDGRSFPLRAGGSGVRGGSVVLPGGRSSQFASALLLTAPAFATGLQLRIDPPRVSFSYVRLTLAVLAAFGAVVTPEGEGGFSVGPQRLSATRFAVEGDHSSASYALAAAAILGGRLRVAGLRAGSSQPDARFLRDLATLGCRVISDREGISVEASGRVPAFSWDLSDAPDLAPTAAVLALFAAGPCTLTGLHHLAFKESDRLELLRENLNRLGGRAAVVEGTLTIVPPRPGASEPAIIRVADDHRIAMAFAVAGLARPGVTIDDPGAVLKSYPRFWEDLARLVRTGS